MKEQQYIIENQESFELKHIFDCGQCFRWNEQNDGSYTGVFKGNVLNVKKIDNKIIPTKIPNPLKTFFIRISFNYFNF